MTSPFEVFRQWWGYYRERPFWRLFRIFVARIFRGGGDSDSEGLDLGVGLVLTLLALPGGFVSVLMFVKYSTFLSWMRGAPNVNPLAVAMPDEYFFIALSMAVAGTVAVWRWDALFPDRRDYMNLVPQPISTWTIFFANLFAVLFLASLISIDVNAASSVLFPLGVGASQTSFLFFVRFILVHVLIVGLASIFAFLAVLSLLGFLLVVLPPRAFRRISPYARVLVVMYFMTMLSTSFAVPEKLQRLPLDPQEWVALLPSCWFLGMWQSLHGASSPALAALGRLALPGLTVALAAAFCVYALGYRRHFLRIPEIADIPSNRRGSKALPFLGWFDRLILRTPFQRGCFHFVWRTLFRSEAQRLALAAIAGLGLVLGSQFLAAAVQNSVRGSAPSADALAIPFVLVFFIVIGVRLVFEIPVDVRSNWIFRLTLDAEQYECRALARNVILTFIVPWLVLIALPLYTYFYGWIVAGLHTLLVAAWSVLLTQAVLIRFRKLPFTCPLPVFQQHSIVTLLGSLFGFFLFALFTPQMESWALSEPLRMILFVPVAAMFWYIPHRMAQSSIEIERGLIFEEVPTSAVEVLRLGD